MPHTSAATTAAAFQLAGLRRRAAIKKAAAQREQQQDEADGVQQAHSTAASGDIASAGGSVSGVEADEGEYSHTVMPNLTHGAALKHTVAEAQTPRPASSAVEQDSGRAAVQPATMAPFAAAADSRIRLSPVLAAKEDPLQCVREFLAEVRARSASNNIVAATLCSLHAHLSERQRFAGEPALSPGGTAASWVAAAAGGGPDNSRRACQPQHTGVAGMQAGRTGDAASRAGVSASRATGGNAIAETAMAAGKGAAGDSPSDAGGPSSAERDERLVSQLAGLKRRAAIKHTA